MAAINPRTPPGWIPNLPPEDQPGLAALYAKSTAPPSPFVQPLPPQPAPRLSSPPVPTYQAYAAPSLAAPSTAGSRTAFVAGYSGLTTTVPSTPVGATSVMQSTNLLTGTRGSVPGPVKAAYNVTVGPSVHDVQTVFGNAPLPLKILAVVDLAGNVALFIPGADLPGLAAKGATRAVEVWVLRGAGITGRMEHAIAGATRIDDVVLAVQSRPLGAAVRDKGVGIGDWRFLQLPAKPRGAETVNKFWLGGRLVRTQEGTYKKVVSDLDMAWAFQGGQPMTNLDAFRTIGGDINRAYGTDIVMHGPTASGILMRAPGQALDAAALDRTVYIFRGGRYVGRGPLTESLFHYMLDIALGQ